MSRRTVFALTSARGLALVGCLVLPTAAYARGTPAPSPTPAKPSAPSSSLPTDPKGGPYTAAESLGIQAAKLYSEEKYEQAHRLYTESYALDAYGGTLLKIAITEYQLHRYADALRHARKYLQSPDAQSWDVKEVETKFIPKCKALTAHVRFEGADGAELAVDTEPAERLTEPAVDLMPGKHRLALQQAGRVVTFNVDLQANEDRTLSLEAPMVVPSAPAPLAVAAVRPTAETRTSSSARWWTVTGLGVASLGSFIAGTVFYVESENAYAKGKSLHASLPSNGACASPVRADLVQPCADLREALTHDYPVNRDRGLGFVIAGSALAVGAVATYFLWPKRALTTTALTVRWVAPDVQQQGAGMRLGGTF